MVVIMEILPANAGVAASVEIEKIIPDLLSVLGGLFIPMVRVRTIGRCGASTGGGIGFSRGNSLV
jgi:hypothetical protein